MNEIERPTEKTYSLSNSSDPVELKDEERQPCEVWTRVMGYFRPVSGWNIGKKQEHADRVYFSEKKSMKHIDTGCAV